MAEKILVKDQGAVPEDKTFSYRLPCTLAYPGMRATKDEDLLAFLKPVANELYNGMKIIVPGMSVVAEFN